MIASDIHATKPKTYVLIGDDNDRDLSIYQSNKDVIIITPKEAASIKDVVSLIKPPANIILDCHGTKEGQFLWKKDDLKSYTELFSTLPRTGISSIMLASCYGGSAEAKEILSSAPPGTIVQSMTGPDSLASGNVEMKFAQELDGVTKPIDFFLKALDNFNPEEYKKDIDYWNGEFKKRVIQRYFRLILTLQCRILSVWVDTHPSVSTYKVKSV